MSSVSLRRGGLTMTTVSPEVSEEKANEAIGKAEHVVDVIERALESGLLNEADKEARPPM